MRRVLLAFALTLASLLGMARAMAEISRSAPQYKRSVWTAEEGAPADVMAITQAPDGYLMLGTSSGLYRFDGVTFAPVAPIKDGTRRSEQINTLYTSRAGVVWIGYDYGGVATYVDGKLQDANGGPPSGEVYRIVESPDGAIWVAAMGKKLANLRRFKNGRWEDVGIPFGLPQGHVRTILASRDGSLWVVMESKLLVLPPNSRSFVATKERVWTNAGLSPVGLAEDRTGRVWLSDGDGLRAVPSRTGPVRDRLPPRRYDLRSAQPGHELFADHAGDLWDVGLSDIVKINNPNDVASARGSIAERVSSTDQTRIGANALSIFEDRERNIWIGTLFGLTSLRPTSIIPDLTIPTSSRTAYALSHVKGSPLYVTSADGIFQVDGLKGPRKVADMPASSEHGCVSPNGDLVIGSQYQFVRYSGGRSTILAAPEGAGPITGPCAFDGDGRLWASIAPFGVYRLDGSKWTHVPVLPKEPRLWPNTMIGASDGAILMSFADKTIVRIKGNRREITILNDEQTPGMISLLVEYGDAVFAGGDKGLLRIRNGERDLITTDRFPYLKNLGGMVRGPRGWTWIAGALGVARVRTAALQEAFDNTSSDAPARIFGARDGLPGTPLRWYGNDLATDSSGQIWVATNFGMAHILRSSIVNNRYVPPVVIRSILVDGVRYAPTGRLSIPKGARNLQIDYTALSFAEPRRVSFRYRLEGVDQGWVNPGPRRQAFYSDLRPGTYRFQVIASNNDGVWNRNGAELTVTIPPTFLQSWWFALICGCLALLALWLLYRLRVRTVEADLRRRLEIRMHERETIARDLHDTLLQSVQGVFLRFQAFADRVSVEDPSRAKLEGTLERAQQVIDEARDRVFALRDPEDHVSIEHIIAEAVGTIPSFSTALVERRIDPHLPAIRIGVAKEVQAILGEALFNAERHAGARRIVIAAEGIDRRIVLSVRDDGVGIPQEIIDAGQRPGHFGLIGMRERAEHVGGRLAIANLPSGGAETVVSLPCPDVGAPRYWLLVTAPWRRLRAHF
jgi:signal transduction histidine kinase/ligand-binding sensor domain-containing protein